MPDSIDDVNDVIDDFGGGDDTGTETKDDAPSGATPNQGTKRMTSAPTGPTETDPEDDPTMWGTHPYDLYVRRGGMG